MHLESCHCRASSNFDHQINNMIGGAQRIEPGSFFVDPPRLRTADCHRQFYHPHPKLS
jgi:hypothetical protein